MNFNAFTTEIKSARNLVYDYQEAFPDKARMASNREEALGQPFSETLQTLENAFTNAFEPLPADLDTLLTNFKNVVINPTPDTANPFAFYGFQGDFNLPFTRRFYNSPFRQAEIKTSIVSLHDEIITQVLAYQANIDAEIDVEENEKKLELMALALELAVAWLAYFKDYTFPSLGETTELEAAFVAISDQKSKYASLPQFVAYFDNVYSLSRLYRDKQDLWGYLLGLIPAPVYTVYKGKYESEYQVGDVIAEVVSPLELNSVEIVRGTVPCGMSFDEVTGKITVSDPASISPGLFLGLVVKMDTEAAVNVLANLTIDVLPNCEPVLVQTPSVSMAKYKVDDCLAKFILVEEGVSITSVKVTEGKLPPGLAVHSTYGNIFVYQASYLKAGSFDFKVEVKDSIGGVSNHAVTLVLGEDEAVPPLEVLNITNVVGSSAAAGDVVASLPIDGATVERVETMSPLIPTFYGGFLVLNEPTGDLKILNYGSNYDGDHQLALVAHLVDGSVQVFTGSLNVSS